MKLTKEQIKGMREVSKPIFSKMFTDKELDIILEKFYSLMRKKGLKEGEPCFRGKGVVGNNFEWTLILYAFLHNLCEQVELRALFGEVPKDLKCYRRRIK